jgi:hypothetical protein
MQKSAHIHHLHLSSTITVKITYNVSTKMRFSTLVAALASASSAAASIYGISAPNTIAPNKTFPLTFNANIDQSSSLDVAVAWGFSPAPGFRGTLGQNFETLYLAGDNSSYPRGTNFTVDVMAPAAIADYKNDTVVVTAGVYQIFGVSGSIVLSVFNVTLNVGDRLSASEVSSEGVDRTSNCP